MRLILILCVALTLAACQTIKEPRVMQPTSRQASPQAVVEQPLIPAAAASMTFDERAQSLVGAESYLSYVETLSRWGRDGWARSTTAKACCEAKK